MGFLIVVILPAIYTLIALLVVVPAWKRAVTAGGSYQTAWVLTLVMSLPFVLLGINRTLVWQADREVDRLCALDGGVHVYETVTLGPENFGPDGTVFPQYQLEAARNPGRGLRYGPDYATKSSAETLQEGAALFMPRLTRRVSVLVRTADQKVLADRVTYTRYGGEPLPGPWAASLHTCSTAVYQAPMDRAVFVNSGRTQ